jgi:hypothetical protein
VAPAQLLPDVVPPHDLATERALLGAALLDPAALDIVRGVPVEDFHAEKNRTVARALCRGAEAGVVDLVLCGQTLAGDGELEAVGGLSYLVQCQEETVPHHAAQYAATLAELARKRTLLRLSHRVAEAAVTGRPSAELVALWAETVDAFPPTAAHARLVAFDTPEVLTMRFAESRGPVAGVIDEATFTLVGGAPKVGKTALVFNLLLRRAVGAPWLGFPTTAGASLVFQAEIPERMLQQRLRLLTVDLGPPIPPDTLRFVTDRSLRLDDPASQRHIRRLVETHLPTLVVFDPLARFMAGDENSGRDMGAVVAFLDRLIETYGCSVLVVHHLGKPSKDDPKQGGQKLRGHSSLFAAADTVLTLERRSDRREQFTLAFELRHALEPEPITLVRTDRLWFEPAPPDPIAEPGGHLQVVAGLAGTGKRYTDLKADLMTLFGLSKRGAENRIRDAVEMGLVVKDAETYRAAAPSGTAADGQ